MTSNKIEPTVKRRVSSGNRGAPLSSLFAAAERQYPGIEEEVGLSSAALRAGELVRGMRKANGWTQTTLAEALGWDQVRISNIERGEGTRGPTFDVLTKIADACGYELQFTPRALAAPVPARQEAEAYDLAEIEHFDIGEFVEVEEASEIATPRRGYGVKRGKIVGAEVEEDVAQAHSRHPRKASESD